jgi:hypothetical protein
MGLKSYKNPNFGNFWDSQLGSPRKNFHLGLGHVARHREYYKGESGGFPQVQAVVSPMSSCLPMVHMCTKSVSITH